MYENIKNEIEEKLKEEHTDKHLLFYILWTYMTNHKFTKELEKIVSDEEIQMYEEYNLNNKEELEKKLKFLNEKIPKLFEIVQKDIDFICYEVDREDLKFESYSRFNKEYDLKIEKLKIAVLIYKEIARYYFQKRVSLGLEVPEAQLNKLLSIERNLLNNEVLNLEKRQKEKLEEFRKENEDIIKSHTKDTLTTMGIFLSIFSVIGLGVSNVLKENVNSSSIFMICGVILITISGLFYLINFNETIEKKNLKILIPIILGIALISIGISISIIGGIHKIYISIK